MKKYLIGVMLTEEEADRAKCEIVRNGANIAGQLGNDKLYVLGDKEFELTFEYEETVSDYCIEFKRIK